MFKDFRLWLNISNPRFTIHVDENESNDSINENFRLVINKWLMLHDALL